MRDVVITGIGIIAPGGVGRDQFCDTLFAGQSRSAFDEDMVTLGVGSSASAKIDDFRFTDWVAEDVITAVQPHGRLAELGVASAYMAMTDAGLSDDREELDCACLFGLGAGRSDRMQSTYEHITDHGRKPFAGFAAEPGFHNSVEVDYVPSYLAERFGFTGPVSAMSAACASGLQTFGTGFELVRRGEVAIALVGGAEAPMNGMNYAMLDAVGALSHATPPETGSRPFDESRSGLLIAEGAAWLVVEDREHAHARGARIYADVLGYSATMNATHMTDLDPEGQPMVETIERVLSDSAVDPGEIDYVQAHGSGTVQNDRFDAMALKSVFGRGDLTVGSVKSTIGHCLGPAGALSTVATVEMLRRQEVPPSINLNNLDPACVGLDYVLGNSRSMPLETVLVTASGFGGYHTAAVLRATVEEGSA